MAKAFGRRSSIFYRLAKKDTDIYSEYWRIYDFHTVVNGNIWYQEHERVTLSENGEVIGDCYHFPQVRLNKCEKDSANAFYRKLQARGYKCIGVFESDIFGQERRIR